jgi:hypothetical protein
MNTLPAFQKGKFPTRKEVRAMLLDMIAALIASVVSGVATHYAIKWLDSSDDDKK